MEIPRNSGISQPPCDAYRGPIPVVVMPLLARAKRRVAAGIGSGAMKADSRQTDFCTYLSAILLGGLVLKAVAGWWWADPVAGLAWIPTQVS